MVQLSQSNVKDKIGAHRRLDLFKVIVSDAQARKINTNFTLEQEYHRMRPQLQHCRLGLGNHLTKK